MNRSAFSAFPPCTTEAYSTWKKEALSRLSDADFVQFPLYQASTPGEWQYETVMCASPTYPGMYSP